MRLIKNKNIDSDLIIKAVIINNYYEKTKRILDIFISIVGIIFTFPIMLLIAFAIKLNSPGPVLFKQKRIGQNKRRKYHENGHFSERRNGRNLKGKQINIYKFRTMRVDADPYAVSPRKPNDVRLTLIGKILRRLCLDELPQFLNVVKGDLSIVGPRPEMPFIVEKYTPLESQRLLAKPGITGPWQMYGSREQFIHENIHYDLEYIKNRSLMLDLRILMKTILFVFRFRNV